MVPYHANKTMGKLTAILPNSLNESLNQAQQNIYNELPKYERPGQHSRPLGFSITESEIRKAAMKLKNKKWLFSDKIRNEMVKACLHTLMLVCEKFLNEIPTLGTMPQT